MHKRQRTLMQKVIDAGKVARTSLGRTTRKNRKYFWGVVGLSSISAAGFFFDLKVGLVAVGISAFVMEWKVAE